MCCESCHSMSVSFVQFLLNMWYCACNHKNLESLMINKVDIIRYLTSCLTVCQHHYTSHAIAAAAVACSLLSYQIILHRLNYNAPTARYVVLVVSCVSHGNQSHLFLSFILSFIPLHYTDVYVCYYYP